MSYLVRYQQKSFPNPREQNVGYATRILIATKMTRTTLIAMCVKLVFHYDAVDRKSPEA